MHQSLWNGPAAASAASRLSAPRTEEELEERLSMPTDGVVRALEQCPGDVLVLGAGGKMGPSLALMLRRVADAAGTQRRIMAVSRFSDERQAQRLRAAGVDVQRCDLNAVDALRALPDAANVILMTGYKFGTGDAPWRTWQTNAAIPALAAARYRDSRIVAFSSGNVYALDRVRRGGAHEDDALAPAGEYGWSCVARERVLEYACRERGTPLSIVRLNYAVDLRYGVLVDLAQRIVDGEPVDLRMGYVNVIWQGDANAQAIQSLPLAASPPFVVNVTGSDIVSVRAAALELGRLLEREPKLVGREADDALLSCTARAQELFGLPMVDTTTLIGWVADWMRRGGRVLGKATHFEERGGRY
jgi:nucleoside-diphosphate-sugar epimerase